MGVAALLVLSPGPTLAIVTRNAVAYGRGPGLATAAGIGVANATYATAAALGLSIVLQRSPAAFTAIRLAGAAYLVWLGGATLWRFARHPAATRVGAEGAVGAIRASTGFRQGVLTNLLHPSIAVFYLSYIPQFIRAGQPFLPRYALLAAIHVAMSTGWMATCAAAVDKLARVLRTPAFARTIEALAGVSLLALGIVVAWSH